MRDDQVCIESHNPGVVAREGGASSALIPDAGVPRPPRKSRRSGHLDDDAHKGNAAAGEGATNLELPSTMLMSPFADTIAEIKHVHRLRQDLHRAEKSLTNQIKAIERRLSGRSPSDVRLADAAHDDEEDEVHYRPDTLKEAGLAFLAVPQLFEARATIHAGRLKPERLMAKLAKTLPVYPWAESIRGFGAMGLAQIIAECGDLSLYSNPAKVWKRMGLAVEGGERMRCRVGVNNGYSPYRRAIMFCIGDSLIKGNRDGEYRALYLARKVYEIERLPDIKPIIAHRRAQRYMEKRLLLKLWQAWRAATGRAIPADLLPPATPYQEMLNGT